MSNLQTIRRNLLQSMKSSCFWTWKKMKTYSSSTQSLRNCIVKVRKLLSSFTLSTTSSTAFDGKGVKLPKLDVPTFGGDVLQLRQIWEQFSVSVHDRSMTAATFPTLRSWSIFSKLSDMAQQKMQLRVCHDLETITKKLLTA